LQDGLARLDFSSGFGAVWELIRATNSYIEDRQPWALNKAGDSAAVAAVLGDCLEALRIVALLASPLIPRAAGELWRRLGLTGTPEEQRLPEAAAWGGLPAGATLEKGAPLFPRIETDARGPA
jgi:methionyl-tRNA synthetase